MSNFIFPYHTIGSLAKQSSKSLNEPISKNLDHSDISPGRFRINNLEKGTTTLDTMKSIEAEWAIRVKKGLMPDIDALKESHPNFQLGKRKLDQAYNSCNYPLPTSGDHRRHNRRLRIVSDDIATKTSISAHCGVKFGQNLIKFLKFKNDGDFYSLLPWSISYAEYANTVSRDFGDEMLNNVHGYRLQLSKTTHEDENEVADEFWQGFASQVKPFFTAKTLRLGQHGEAYDGSIIDRDQEEQY